jgi:fructokinase
MPKSEILCVGEVLWDSLPAGLFLGGSPFNVACHLRAAGLPVAMVSRVGSDQLGQEVLRRAARYGICTDLIQVDESLPTGFVRVTVDNSGDSTFDIPGPAAWDAIAPDDALIERAGEARAIIYGSLAQRNVVTRRTMERLWATDALMVYDVNLRPPHTDRDIVRRSLERADVVKVNHHEMATLAKWFGLPASGQPAASALSEMFDCAIVCLTRGRDGAGMWRDGAWTDHPGFEVEVRDTVGAGDAFLAVLLAGIFAGTESRALLTNANLIGAFMVTQAGAVPADQLAAEPPAFPAEGRA